MRKEQAWMQHEKAREEYENAKRTVVTKAAIERALGKIVNPEVLKALDDLEAKQEAYNQAIDEYQSTK